jgi:Fe-S cluster assembly protein SufB
MSTSFNTIRDLAEREYKWGFVTSVEEERVPKGLNEDIIRVISAKKNEPVFMLQWRLKAYRHWASLEKAQAEPNWANVKYEPIDYQEIVYYSAPKTETRSDEPGGTESGNSAHLRKTGYSA